jgi:tetratricopeptide (TPR) repeat protein
MKKSMAAAVILVMFQASTAPVFAGTGTLADTMFKDADSCDISENYKAAITKYLYLISKLHQSDPSNPKIYRAQARLARIYVLQKHFDEAEPLFDLLTHTDHSKLEVDPEVIIDLDDLSDAYSSLANNLQYGLESLKRSMALRKYINPDHPRLPDSYLAMARYYQKRSNFKESIDWTLKAIALERRCPVAKQGPVVREETFLSTMYLKLNEVDEAHKTVQDALSLVTRCACAKGFIAQLHCNLGRVYSSRGLFDQAEKEYQLSMKNVAPKAPYANEWPAQIMRWRRENEMMRRQAKNNPH